MGKRKWIWIIAIAAVLAIAGLTIPFANQKTAVLSLRFPTAATTGTLYPLGASLAGIWNEKAENVRVTAQASGGGVDNLNFLREKEAELGVAVTSIAYQSYTGTGAFENAGNPNLRVIAGLYYNPNQLVVRADAGIAAITDIRGKRFAPGAPGSTTVEETQKHLEAAGLVYPDDFAAEYVGFNEAIDLMRNRQLDGAWIMAGIPTAAVSEMCATAGARLIPITADVLTSLQARYPWYVPFTIPANTYQNQTEDIETSAIKMVLLTNADVDEATVYQLTKLLWENIATLQENFAALDGLTVAGAVTDLAGVPLHDGAAKYYREIGILE